MSSSLENIGKTVGEAAASAAKPEEPKPPPNPKQELANQVKAVTAAAQTVSDVASVIADPKGAIKDFAKSQALKQMDKLIPGFSDAVSAVTEAMTPAGAEAIAAKLTNNLAAALGPFPAATLTSMALGAPHAHVKHPPSGPPPVPPTPLPPLGPVLLGTCIQVLINKKPAARCGDLGINPTCCGILPPLSAMYEIMTGSSNVYFGGTRAARVGIDITLHCKGGGGGAGKAASAAGKMSKMAKIAAVAATVASVFAKIAAVGQVVSDFEQAEADDNAAMAAAIALNAAMTAAQAAADAVAAAMSKQKGTDLPMIPPTGTPGMLLNGAATVMVGGLPMPSFAKVAAAVSNRVKGLGGSRSGGGGGGGGGGGSSAGGAAPT